jgi:hypothetical protein
MMEVSSYQQTDGKGEHGVHICDECDAHSRHGKPGDAKCRKSEQLAASKGTEEYTHQQVSSFSAAFVARYQRLGGGDARRPCTGCGEQLRVKQAIYEMHADKRCDSGTYKHGDNKSQVLVCIKNCNSEQSAVRGGEARTRCHGLHQVLPVE